MKATKFNEKQNAMILFGIKAYKKKVEEHIQNLKTTYEQEKKEYIYEAIQIMKSQLNEIEEILKHDKFMGK